MDCGHRDRGAHVEPGCRWVRETGLDAGSRGCGPPRSSIVAEADVPAATQPPTTQARVASAPAVKAPATPVAPTPAPEARVGLPR